MKIDASIDRILRVGALWTMALGAAGYAVVLKQQLNSIETSTTVDRIVRLNKIECRDPEAFPIDLKVKRDLAVARYEELVGTPFGKGKCNTE